jgi:hypothetical protein
MYCPRAVCNTQQHAAADVRPLDNCRRREAKREVPSRSSSDSTAAICCKGQFREIRRKKPRSAAKACSTGCFKGRWSTFSAVPFCCACKVSAAVGLTYFPLPIQQLKKDKRFVKVKGKMKSLQKFLERSRMNDAQG